MTATIQAPSTQIEVTGNAEPIKVGCCINTGVGGENNTASNVGGGDAGIFRDKSGWVLNLRTLNGGSNITITENADTIDIDATAAANEGELLFYVGGVYTGDSNLTWDRVTATLGIGSQLEINANELNNVNAIRFDTTPVDGPEVGKLIWDENEGTLCVGMPGGNVNLQIGQEFLIPVRNNTGSQIDNGKAVYMTGAIGNRPTVALADNSSLTTASVFGIATEDIPNNSDGYVTFRGKVNDVNTSIWGPGTILWLGTNGNMQTTRPDAPATTVAIGEVVRQSTTIGSFTCGPVVLPRLTALSDVNIRETAIANENLVWWDAANSRWDQVTTATLSGSIDHSLLLNLDTNDHPQYTLRSDWLQNGFVDRTLSTLTWTDTSPDRTLSIQPTGASFTYFVEGVPYVSTGDTVQLSDVEGVHWIYYDGATLTSVANPTSIQEGALIKSKALVSVVYWDTSEGTAIYVGEERHGYSMSPDSHAYSHFLRGLQYEQGLGLNALSVDGTGVTADAQFGVDAGLVVDEDLAITISAVGSTTGLPIYYMTGAAADWNRYVESGFSMRTYDGTSGTRLAWNEWTGSAWQLTEAGNNEFVLCHIFATTEKDYPMIAVMGQYSYPNKPAAQSGATTEIETLVLGALPIPEIRPVATVIFKTNTAYANVINALVASTAEGDDYIDWRDEVISRRVVSTSDHSALTGRGNDDHVQYSLVDGTRAFTGTVEMPALGIGTGTVPHAGTGAALLALHGTGFSVNGPHTQFTIAGDNYPLFQQLNYSHDNVSLNFDASFGSAGWKSSDGGSNFQVIKVSDTLKIRYEYGVAQGGAVTWKEAFAIDTTGRVTLTGTTDTEQLIVKRSSVQTLAHPDIQIQNASGTPMLDIKTNDPTNILLGVNAGVSLTTATGMVAIGSYAAYSQQDNGTNVAIGQNALYSCVSGSKIVAIGQTCMQNYLGSNAVGIGYAAGKYQTGGQCVYIGRESGFGVSGSSTGEDHTCVGYMSGKALTTAQACTLFGYQAGYAVANTAASYSCAFGQEAMLSNTGGIGCVAIGRHAFRNAVGGDHNVSVGYDSCGRQYSGEKNVNVGNFSGRGVASKSYSYSTNVGYAAGLLLETGSHNCLYGYYTGSNITDGSYNILIGDQLDASSATVSYELNIGDAIKGDLSVGDVFITRNLGINTSSLSQALEIGGTDAKIYMNSADSNMVVFGAGAGVPTRTTSSPGTKLLLNDSVGAFQVDTAIGFATAMMWFSIPNNTDTYRFYWYADTSAIMSLDGTGKLVVTGTTQMNADLTHAGSNIGFFGTAPTSQATALTTALTQISHTGPTTPDYAIATPVSSGTGATWGFSTQDEFETAMSVILNLQTRVDELESKLQAYGLLA